MNATTVGRGLRAAVLSGLVLTSPARAQVTPLNDGDRAAIVALLTKDGGFGNLCDGVILPGSPRTALVSIDYSGRHFCNRVMRIRLARRPSILDTFESHAVDEVAAIVRSASPDGRVEIALPQAFTDAGDRSQCRAVVASLLRCDRSRCVETSRRSRFLNEQLTQREQALVTLTDSAEDLATRRRACLTAERDKLLRMSGRDRGAGVTQADQWTASSDPFLRRGLAKVWLDARP